MSGSSKKDTQSINQQEPNDQQLVNDSLQKSEKKQSKDLSNQQNDNNNNLYISVESQTKYVIKEHSKIKEDFQDFNDLETEIQRLQKIKNEYKEQKQSIQQLNKIVQTLKSENKSLKLEKDSVKDHSQKKDRIQEIQRRINNQEKKNRKLSDPQKNGNKFKGNIVNRQMPNKIFNMDNATIERFLSPQAYRTNSLRNSARLNLQQNHMNEMLRADQQMMIQTHKHNKKAVIASFVEELKHQLEQNQLILQRQKKSHRQTKQKLEICLQQLTELRLMFERQRNNDTLERENIQLRKQLESEIEQRLLAQEKLRQKELLLSQFEMGFAYRSSDFDHELDKMDQIYFKLERTLKL